MPSQWGSFAWGAGLGVLGGPIIGPLVSTAFVRPLAGLAADASTYFAQAKAAQFAEAQRLANYMAAYQSGFVNSPHPQNYNYMAACQSGFVNSPHPQTQPFAGFAPTSTSQQGQGVVGCGWIFAPMGTQQEASPMAHAASTHQDLGAVLSEGFRHLMEGLADIARKVDSLEKQKHGHASE